MSTKEVPPLPPRSITPRRTFFSVMRAMYSALIIPTLLSNLDKHRG
jgi:hypothetical protein